MRELARNFAVRLPQAHCQGPFLLGFFCSLKINAQNRADTDHFDPAARKSVITKSKAMFNQPRPLRILRPLLKGFGSGQKHIRHGETLK
ncbi:MAG: hypothetical protein ABJU19_12250 [Roseobacter sp.]